MLRRYICLSRISVGFCHFYVISLFTLSSTAIEGEQLAKFWNKMNWTAVTQPLKRSSWSYLPWVVVNPSGSKYMAILLSNILVTLFQPENRSKAKFEAQWGCPSGGWGGGYPKRSQLLPWMSPHYLDLRHIRRTSYITDMYKHQSDWNQFQPSSFSSSHL